MANIYFQESNERWENQKGAFITVDGSDENFLYIKQGTAKKQIKITLHKTEAIQLKNELIAELSKPDSKP